MLIIRTGSDGVHIWDLWCNVKLRSPNGAGERGATTALTWVRCDDKIEDGLVYGTQGGYIISWKEIRAGETSVSCHHTRVVDSNKI